VGYNPKVTLRKAAAATGRSAKNIKKQLNKVGISTKQGVDLSTVKQVQSDRAELNSNYIGNQNSSKPSMRTILDMERAKTLRFKREAEQGKYVLRETINAQQAAGNEVIISDMTAFPNKVASRLVNIKKMTEISEILRDELAAIIKHWREGGVMEDV